MPMPATWCGQRGPGSRACRLTSTTWFDGRTGPRASIYLIMAGKARAILNGRVHVTTEDIARVALPGAAAPHPDRLYGAEAAGMNSDKVIERLLRDVPRTRDSGSVKETPKDKC